MRYDYYEQRMVPYGTVEISVFVRQDEYKPTNTEVMELAAELLGLPVRDKYEKLRVNLYWHQNIRVFECIITSISYKKWFRQKFDRDGYFIMTELKNAGCVNDWIVTNGNDSMEGEYVVNLIKVVE